MTGMLDLGYDLTSLLNLTENQIASPDLIEDCKTRTMQQIKAAVLEKISDGRKYQVEICKEGVIDWSIKQGAPSYVYKVWANVFLLDPEESLLGELVVINWGNEDFRLFEARLFATESGKMFSYAYTTKGDRIWKRIS